MLAARSGDAFHLDDRWFACWSEAFGPVLRHHGLTLVADRERVGLLRVKRLRSATNPHSARYDVAPGQDATMISPRRLLVEHGARLVRFDYLAEDAALLDAARGWAATQRVRIAPHALSPVVDCRRTHDQWLASRSKRIRQRLRRDGKEAFDRLGMTVEFQTDDPTRSDLFDRMLAVEQSGWKGRGGTAIRDNPAELRFYTGIARAAAEAGALHLALLWHGDRLVAFELGVRGGRRLFLLKVGYDEEFAEMSAGYLLAAEHIRHCVEHPAIDWYDKMGNGMSPAEYKLRFADHCDVLYRVTIYADGPVGWLVQTYDTLRARAKAWRDARRAGA